MYGFVGVAAAASRRFGMREAAAALQQEKKDAANLKRTADRKERWGTMYRLLLLS
jgi:hypothetical protein